MGTANRPVVNLLIGIYQNCDSPEEVMARLGTFIEGLAKANGMSPETMAHEIKRFFDHCDAKKTDK